MKTKPTHEQLFEDFSDTDELAQWLYDLAHDHEIIGLSHAYKYFIMEARDNLLGLHGLCQRLVVEANDNKPHGATAGKSIARRIAELQADERAHRIATEAAEEFIRTECPPTDNPNEFIVQPEWVGDEQFEDCLEHLKWAGQCVVFENGEDTTVLLGDYSMESPA